VIEDEKTLLFQVPDDDGFVEHSHTQPISDEVIFSMTPYQILERNSIAEADFRGLRFDLFDYWQEIYYGNHSSFEIVQNNKEGQSSKDAQGCSDISTLHLSNDTKIGKELWRDYNVEIEYRHKVHHVHDPGIVSIPAHDHCYMVFHEVKNSKVKMSIWNDFDHFDYAMSHFSVPDRENIFKSYPVFDLLDGDYFTVSNHFPGNYGHFLHDHLPFIAYARHMLPQHTKFILVDNEADRKRLQFIDPQFESERVIWAEQKMIYKVSAGSISGLPPPATRHIINRYSLLREWVLLKPSFRTDQRTIIYYTRSGFDVRNGRFMDSLHEKVLINLVKQKMMEHGRNEHLVIFDGKENGQPMSLQHQFDLFRTARVVIGPHGSGLANILWLPGAATCEERPKVLEFLVQPTQTDIQVGGSLKTYMYLYGFPKWVDYHHLYYTSYSTSQRMSVDVKHFVQALEDMFKNDPSPYTSSRTKAINNLLRNS
jgi:Glycosyltransferase 61